MQLDFDAYIARLWTCDARRCKNPDLRVALDTVVRGIRKAASSGETRLDTVVPERWYDQIVYELQARGFKVQTGLSEDRSGVVVRGIWISW